MNERSNAASGKKTYTPLAKPCNFSGLVGKIKSERACAKSEFALQQPDVWQPEAGEIEQF
jgi:hypothetical protein